MYYGSGTVDRAASGQPADAAAYASIQHMPLSARNITSTIQGLLGQLSLSSDRPIRSVPGAKKTMSRIKISITLTEKS